MKNVLKIILFVLISQSAFAQPLPDGATLELENVECVGSTISFDLSFTLDGLPLTVDGTYDMVFGNSDNSEIYFTLINDEDPDPYDITDGDVLDMFLVSVMLEDGVSCGDLLNITAVYLNTFPSLNVTYMNGTSFDFYGNSEPGRFSDTLEFELAPIPTLGQWGLIILGISLLIGGIISVRRNVFV